MLVQLMKCSLQKSAFGNCVIESVLIVTTLNLWTYY